MISCNQCNPVSTVFHYKSCSKFCNSRSFSNSSRAYKGNDSTICYDFITTGLNSSLQILCKLTPGKIEGGV